MKFLCPSCKAKYQIADEKVVGRSVRMKCRKCGFIIPISEVPPAPPSMLPGANEGALPAVPKAPAPAVVKPGIARTPPSPATRDSRVPPPAPGTRDSRVPPPARRDQSAERRRPTLAELKSPPGGAPAAARPAPAAAAPPRGAAATAASPAPAPPAARTPFAAPASPPAAQDLMSALDDEEDQGTRISSAGALAAAFGALVTEEKAPALKDGAGMPADEWFVAINDVPVGPIRLGEIRKRAMLGAVTRDSLVWRDGHETWRPLSTYPELVAVLEESMSAVHASPVALLPAAGRAAAEALSPSSGGVTSTAVVTDEFHVPGVARTRMPILGWIAIIVALAFGLVIGFVVFNKQKPPETVYKYVEVPSKGTDQPIAAAAQGAEQTGGPDPAASGKPRTKSGIGTKVAGTQADKGSNGEGLSGLKGLSGLSPGGPGTPGSTPGSTAPAGGGGQLDASQIQGTVSRYTGAVKRRCWQPALDGRDPSAPSTARVVVTIGVAGSGSVSSVSTNGDPRGYPGLSNCIASSVRAWQFPATGSSSTAVVPFVFAAQ